MQRELLRRLHQRLGELVLSHRLTQMGWYDFLRFDCPNTDDPVELAVAALLYLTVIDGEWNYEVGVLYGVLAFLAEECYHPPASWEREQIEKLLNAAPVDSGAIRNWFRATYSVV